MENPVAWFMNIVPLLLLVGFWIYIMRQRGSTGWWTSQKRQVELLEEQIKVLRETNELLRKLATSR